MKYIFIIVIAVLQMFVAFSCTENDSQPISSNIDDIENSDPIPDIVDTIINELLTDIRWLDDEAMDKINQSDMLRLSDESFNDLVSLNNMKIPDIVDIQSADEFWYEERLYKIVIELFEPIDEQLEVDQLRSLNTKWGIIFDTDYYSDIPVGEYYYISSTAGSIIKEEIDLRDNPNFPLFILSLEDITPDMSMAKTTGEGAGYYLVLVAIQTYIDREGSGNMEYMMYRGPICDDYNDSYQKETTYNFDGNYHVDAHGDSRLFPDVNNENVLYACDQPIALMKLTDDVQWLVSIESDYDGTDHVNDKDGTDDCCTKYHRHDMAGYNALTGSSHTVNNRQFCITRDNDGGDDDIFWNSEIFGITEDWSLSTWPYYNDIYTPDYANREVRYRLAIKYLN